MMDANERAKRTVKDLRSMAKDAAQDWSGIMAAGMNRMANEFEIALSEAANEARLAALEEAQKIECYLCGAVGRSRWGKVNSSGKHFSTDGEEKMCEVQVLSRRIAELRANLVRGAANEG